MEQTYYTRQEADSLIASTNLVNCAYVIEKYRRVKTMERTTNNRKCRSYKKKSYKSLVSLLESSSWPMMQQTDQTSHYRIHHTFHNLSLASVFPCAMWQPQELPGGHDLFLLLFFSWCPVPCRSTTLIVHLLNFPEIWPFLLKKLFHFQVCVIWRVAASSVHRVSVSRGLHHCLSRLLHIDGCCYTNSAFSEIWWSVNG